MVNIFDQYAVASEPFLVTFSPGWGAESSKLQLAIYQKPMSRFSKLLILVALAISTITPPNLHGQRGFPQGRPGLPQRGFRDQGAANVFVPLRSLHTLRARGYGDDAVSSFIMQSTLLKKDRALAWSQHDIDDNNGMLLDYVIQAVNENGSFLLRRKLVEVFGQTSHTTLINRMRLVAVLLGSERGSGGMDRSFRAIREETHRISPYVTNQVAQYLRRLENRLTPAERRRPVDRRFKAYVDALGESHESEYAAAHFGARYTGRLVEEIYAMKTLLRDLKIYYGVREEGDAAPRYETIFANPGRFKSETFTKLKQRHDRLGPAELADSFITVGLELRDHLSNLRAGPTRSTWHDTEQIEHLKKITEISVSATGLFASVRAELSTIEQARTLVDLLFLEGLYSKKERKALRRELKETLRTGVGHEEETRNLHTFLGYMHGLGYANLDESLGKAARAFVRYSQHAERYMEFEARKSALQVLGQLQQEFYQKHSKILAGKNDIHLGGTARGTVRVFQTQAAIEKHLRQDPTNGAGTIWVLKSGLTMPNEASFAAIIMEDPIMKASHYDGYARSQSPPLPLMQIPEASQKYRELDGLYVMLKASPGSDGEVTLRKTSSTPSAIKSPKKILRLAVPEETVPLLEIQAPLEPEEIRRIQQHAGAKAANYAFLRSHLPLNRAKNQEHIYPGFAIPFHFYEKHLERNGVKRSIAGLRHAKTPKLVRTYLERIRAQILQGNVSRLDLRAILAQIETQLLTQHPIAEGTDLKLRFRSSSNAEDNMDFSGAGLYESHSAYYSPGGGFASKSEEDIANALKRVWASTWNPEAYHARQRVGIDQESARMGILVHPSYRKEESTGVVYYHGPNDIEIAVNDGNENVQNPRIAGLTPEMHRLLDGNYSFTPSSCFALSGKDILSSSDRKKLRTLLEIIVPKFQTFHAKHKVTSVDIEFKVMERRHPDGDTEDVVILKQIRPLAAKSP